jgi:uncharacterized membrane protein YeaQ/YmgE (transglycosylase-associated protein family)
MLSVKAGIDVWGGCSPRRRPGPPSDVDGRLGATTAEGYQDAIPVIHSHWHRSRVVGRSNHEGRGYGLVGDLVVGVIGALLGDFLFGLLGISAGGLLGSLITATVGAIVLIALP